MLERIWHRNFFILRSIVQNILIDRSAAEDVLQEAFAKILSSKIEFRSEGEAYGYIRRVVLNTSIDHYRSLKRRNHHLKNTVRAHLSHWSPNPSNPLSLLMEKERNQWRDSVLEEVRNSLKELPRQQKEAIQILFNRNDTKIKDLCKEKGIPYSTLRSRVTAGIDRIRNRLKAKGVYHIFEEVKKK